MQTTIVVADDHPIVRSGIRRIVGSREDLEVVGEAANGRELLDVVLARKPDLAIIDIEMPRLSGMDAARSLSRLAAQTQVLVLSVHESGRCVEEAFRAGVAGYISKTDGLVEILHAIDAIRSGGSYLSPRVSCHVVGGDPEDDEDLPAFSPLRLLTEREREVLLLVAEGCSTRQAAERMGLSVKTVETHRANLMQKLGIHKVPGLVRLAVREGLVRP
jgi:DNA-binding NarL/FixJ family response regulator